MPTFPHNKGPEVFKGKVLHTIDYCKLNNEATSDLLKGKKVVVIGFKKSATDIAMDCAHENQGNNSLLRYNLFILIYIPCSKFRFTLFWKHIQIPRIYKSSIYITINGQG